MKITGAPSDSPTDDTQQQQLPTLRMLNSFVTIEEKEEAGRGVSSETSNEKLVKVASLNEAPDQNEVLVGVHACEGSSVLKLRDEDEGFLDVLVDAFDADFDFNMLL